MSIKIFTAAMLLSSQANSFRFPKTNRFQSVQSYSSNYQNSASNANGHSRQKTFRFVSRTDEDGHTETDEDLVKKRDGKVVKKEHEHIIDDEVTEHTSVIDGSEANDKEDELETMSKKMIGSGQNVAKEVMKKIAEMQKEIFEDFDFGPFNDSLADDDDQKKSEDYEKVD